MHRPDLSPRAAAGGAAAGAAKGGTNVVPFLIGCGCLGLVAVGVIAAFVLGVGFFTVKKVADENKDLVRDVKSIGQEMARARDAVRQGRSGDGSTEAISDGSDDPAAAERRNALNGQNFLQWSNGAVTREDLLDHLKFSKEWEGSPEITSMKAGLKGLQDLPSGQEQSAGDKLKVFKSAVQLQGGAARAFESFETRSRPFGGSEQVVQRAIRSGVVATAALGLAKEMKQADPASDAVADAMLARQPEARKQYEAWKQATSAFFKEGLGGGGAIDPAKMRDPAYQKKLGELSKAMTEANAAFKDNNGLLMLGKADASSLKAWRSLDVATRKALLGEALGLPTLPGVIFAPNTRGPLFASYLQALEYNQLVGKLKAELANTPDAP